MLKTFDPGCAYEPTNLDDLSVDATELASMGKVYAMLADYCDQKSKAMVARMTDATDTAGLREAECERIYAKLPQWARW